MNERITTILRDVVQELFGVEPVVLLERPDEQFGDVTTNVAMKLAKELQRPPRDIAQEIAEKLQSFEMFDDVGVAGPGFVNMTFSDEALMSLCSIESPTFLNGIKTVVEYSCPNYFKELHTGHLYQTIAGDVIARLLEQAGAKVYRTNFGGDVGLHVAKCIFGMLYDADELPESVDGYNDCLNALHTKMQHMNEDQRTPFIATSYVTGSKLYEEDDAAKGHIELLNKRLYAAVKQPSSDEFSTALAKVHQLGRQWSKEYFVSMYKTLQVHQFDAYYPESTTEARGVEIVEKNKSLFEESDGAIVFKGEDHGLHTRVFITNKQLPTYETKDLGLIFTEQDDYHFDRRILITGNDQSEYMKVVWKVADLIKPGINDKMTHVVNGIVKFGDGKKMSSRTGNVTTATDVLRSVREAVGNSGDEERDTNIYLGAVKYEFLKHRLGGDMAFDPNESVAIEGNSGPYLQYAHARARSIVAKSDEKPAQHVMNLDASERSLARKLTEFNDVVEQSARELAPHYICTYLYELAQIFNRFYEKTKVIDSEREAERIFLVTHYANVLKHGLNILGIHAPDSM